MQVTLQIAADREISAGVFVDCQRMRHDLDSVSLT
jgi:hypothetical protein